MQLYPCRLLPFAVFHFNQMSGFFRSVPSPEHGTSHSTRSNFSVTGEPSSKGNHSQLKCEYKQMLPAFFCNFMQQKLHIMNLSSVKTSTQQRKYWVLIRYILTKITDFKAVYKISNNKIKKSNILSHCTFSTLMYLVKEISHSYHSFLF